MKRILSSLIFVLALQGIACSVVFANSETYRISVTIPAIPGVNVHKNNHHKKKHHHNLQARLKEPNSATFVKETKIRNNQKVTLLSYTVE